MIKKLPVFIFVILLAVIQINCGGCGSSDDEEIQIDSSELQVTDLKYDSEAINEIIQSFSSPVEMAATMHDLNVPFSKKYLVNTEDVDDYDTNFKKALALGILSADLGYLNVYGKTSQVIEYLAVIKRITDDLKVGQFFDYQALKRLATTNDNIDSLLYLSVHSFHQMDEYLRNNQRSNLSALVVTGVWIEGLYLATQVIKEKYSDELKDIIGEQKTILNSLLPILSLYQKDPNFEKLVMELQELKDAFDGVKITYEVGEPETQFIDGELVIIQNDKSIIEMSKEQLQEIITVTEKIRNKLIAL